MKKISLVGIYPHVDELIIAIKKAKEKKPDKLVVYTPAPVHEVQNMLESKRSKVRYFTLLGAIAGLFGGFFLAIWSSLKWNLITGGKPPVSIVPFVVVGFEMTILFGALATLIGLILTNQFPNYRISDTYDERFSNDKFGIAVKIPEEDKQSYEQLLQSTGAEEINVR
jgi:molybdopterin-containing oxidoreductase family membrane subunit